MYPLEGGEIHQRKRFGLLLTVVRHCSFFGHDPLRVVSSTAFLIFYPIGVIISNTYTSNITASVVLLCFCLICEAIYPFRSFFWGGGDILTVGAINFTGVGSFLVSYTLVCVCLSDFFTILPASCSWRGLKLRPFPLPVAQTFWTAMPFSAYSYHYFSSVPCFCLFCHIRARDTNRIWPLLSHLWLFITYRRVFTHF